MNKQHSGLKVALVGATGAVGRALLSTLTARGFAASELIALASKNSVGEALPYNDDELTVRELSKDSFAGVDLAFFAAGSERAALFAPLAAAAGCVVIDCSGNWSMDDRCPLVVPEVNPEALDGHRGIIASPGGVVTQLAVVLKPLHEAANIRRVVVSTYQSVSGSGQKGIDELDRQVRRMFNLQPPEIEVYPHQVAFNCLPVTGAFMPGDYTAEEMQLKRETAKILGDADIKITATCVRVPVFYCHCASVNIETQKKLSGAEARAVLSQAKGVQVADNPGMQLYPMPIDATSEYEVFAGRIREDESLEHGLNLWVVADNLFKGSALNMVQIAETLLEKDLLRVKNRKIFL
jgi:aspartate-semialdehyde dehydrogenase